MGGPAVGDVRGAQPPPPAAAARGFPAAARGLGGGYSGSFGRGFSSGSLGGQLEGRTGSRCLVPGVTLQTERLPVANGNGGGQRHLHRQYFGGHLVTSAHVIPPPKFHAAIMPAGSAGGVVARPATVTRPPATHFARPSLGSSRARTPAGFSGGNGRFDRSAPSTTRARRNSHVSVASTMLSRATATARQPPQAVCMPAFLVIGPDGTIRTTTPPKFLRRRMEAGSAVTAAAAGAGVPGCASSGGSRRDSECAPGFSPREHRRDPRYGENAMPNPAPASPPATAAATPRPRGRGERLSDAAVAVRSPVGSAAGRATGDGSRGPHGGSAVPKERRHKSKLKSPGQSPGKARRKAPEERTAEGAVAFRRAEAADCDQRHVGREGGGGAALDGHHDEAAVGEEIASAAVGAAAGAAAGTAAFPRRGNAAKEGLPRHALSAPDCNSTTATGASVAPSPPLLSAAAEAPAEKQRTEGGRRTKHVSGPKDRGAASAPSRRPLLYPQGSRSFDSEASVPPPAAGAAPAAAGAAPAAAGAAHLAVAAAPPAATAAPPAVEAALQHSPPPLASPTFAASPQPPRTKGLFSTAIPITGLMAIMVGTGIIICDKQREVAYYRYRSAGTRTQRLEEEHDKLVQFMNETKPLAPEEIVYKPIPKERDTVV